MLELVEIIYLLTKQLPEDERFGLSSQMRGAGVSVISNFAEGYGRRTKNYRLHFMNMSDTSLSELEAQADVCVCLKYWKEKDFVLFLRKKSEVGYLLNRYISKVK